jgi:hypothetical protein
LGEQVSGVLGRTAGTAGRGHRLPYDIYQAPKNWIEDSYPNLMYWNEVERGGHFAALEVPELYVTEVRNAFRSLRGL